MGTPTHQKYRAVVAENAALKQELDEIKGRFAAEFKASVDDDYPGMHIYPAAGATWGESVLNLGAAERNKYCKEQNLSGSAIANLKKASRLYKQTFARNKYRKMKRAKERGESENRLPAHPIRFFKGYA